MRKFLLATTGLLAATAAHAQSCSVPGPADAAGFNTETFGSGGINLGTTPNPSTSYPEMTGNTNVVPYTFTGTSWKNIGVANNGNSVTLNGTGEAFGNGLATAEVTPAGQPLQGVAFGGGGYFQVTMAGNGPMSFWMNDAETMNGASNGTGADSEDSWMEADIAEFDSTGVYGFALHNWYGAIGSGNDANTGAISESPVSPPGANYTQPNTYGMLWVQATATTQGYAKFYFDGTPVGNTITWNQYVPGQSATANPFAMMDALHMVPILGAGNGSTVTFSNLQVWQANGSNDIGTGAAAAAAAQQCSGGSTIAPTPTPVATPAAAIAASLAGTAPTSSASPSSNPAITTPAPTSAAPPASQITPGNDSLTDCQGNVWTISASGSIEENGQWTPGGGGTSALSIQNCTVYGQDNGHDGNTVNLGGWFTLSSNGQYWTSSSAPATSTATSAALATTTLSGPTAAPLPAVTPGTVCAAVGATSSGFHVAGGQIIGPNGQPFIARGINMADSNMGDAAAAIALFPGLNFVRLAIYSYQDPSAYASFINTMTSRGTVVEIEHHVETNGYTGGGGQGSIASGAWLAAENAFYASVAKAYASNPYVWFGTTNEPPGGPGLSQWQQATYQAIRGQGNNNPIMLENGGWPSNWTGNLDPSVYVQMTNVIWDDHFYPPGANNSTDQNTVTQAIMSETTGSQAITSADGTVPALIGEYGVSTFDNTMSPGAVATVSAIVTLGANGQYGSAAWHWGMQDCCNNLNSGSTLTNPYGQMVALYINNHVTPLNQCQATQGAQAATAAIQQQMATDPSTPRVVAPTAANAAAAAAANATVTTKAQAAAHKGSQ